jgi:formylmethanofuran dehydrogenase subunit E
MGIKKDFYEPTADKSVNIGKVKCSKCNRELISPNKMIGDWIGNNNNVLCEACYQDLLFPPLSNSYVF